ncbi:MAG: SusC/RagA family TonB-linked outer membrane protein [Anditalea sp.]
MKCKLIRQLENLTRYALVGILMSCCFGGTVLAKENPVPKKGLDEIFIEIKLQNASLQEVLTDIEQKTEFQFIYNEKILTKHHNIDVLSDSKSLADVLKMISQQTQLAFKRLDDNIHIRDKSGRESVVEEKIKNTKANVVSGTVTSQTDGETLPGVTVVIKGTAAGTVTDLDGYYTLDVPNEDDILVFSSIGYISQEVSLNGRSVVDVVLAEDVQNLEEVVVIGYGTVRREELTSSVSSIKEEDFISGAVNDPIQMIDGKVAGLTMGTAAAADPNAGSSLQIRGVASVNAGTGPLIVVDGVPGRNLNTIPKDEIESITVLKDGASSAIYGARGANGVILVTTKKGDGGATSVSYEGHISTNFVAKKPEILSAQEYVAYGRSNTYDPSEADNLPYANNFYNELLNDLSLENYQHLAIDGGSTESSYRLSMNYRDTKGMDISSHRNDYGARLNFNYSIRDKVDVFGNVYVNKSNRERTNYMAFRQAIKAQPTEPIFDPENPTQYYLFSGYDYYNPIALLKNNINRSEHAVISGDVNVRWHILDNLSTSLLLAENFTEISNYSYQSSESRDSRDNQYAGRASRGQVRSNDKILEWTANYFLERNNHNVQVLGGYSYQEFVNEGFSAWNANFPSDALLWNNLGGGTWHSTSGGQVVPSSSKSSSNLIAFFGRVNYNFDGTYLLSASLRREGSSKFGANNKWGMFPGISAGWVLSKMEFFNLDFINNLKIRASYGATGREDISSLLSVPTYRTHSFYNMEGDWLQSWGPSSNPNPDLKWEVGINTNIGIDLITLNEKLSFSVDLYKRETRDLLFYTPTPKPPFIYGNTWSNVGSIQNKGIEMVADWIVVKNQSFQYTTSVVASYGKSKMLKINDDVNEAEDGSTFMDLYNLPAPGNPGTIVRLEEGEEIGNFFMYKHAGIDESGNFLIYNTDDEVIVATQKSAADKQYVGNGIPDITLSWNNSFTYKNFDLTLFFKGAFLWDVVNLHQMYYGLSNAPGNVLKDAYGKNANIKAEKETSSYFMEKGDYLSLRNLSLGYTFPLRSGSFFKKVRGNLNASNLFTITEYSGLDPTQLEVNGLTPGIQSMDFYPSTRSFTLAVQLTF